MKRKRHTVLHAQHRQIDTYIMSLFSFVSGVLKCKKDKAYPRGHLCPVCASPKHLAKKTISDLKSLTCTGPVIDPSEKAPAPAHSHSELLSAEELKGPFGNITLNLSDEHGNKVDLSCHIEAPGDATKIAWEQIGSEQIATNLTLSLDLECPIEREDYERLWKLIAYYSEVPVHLQREIMLSKEPKLSYRYRQDAEKDAYYYTGVRANIVTQPTWLMQPLMNLQLNRPQSTAKNVKLLLGTHFSSSWDIQMIRRHRRDWVMIERNNKTQTAVTAVTGGMIEMDCNVLSSGHASVRWMRPDGSKTKAPYTSPDNRITISSNGKLVIKALSQSDAGVYYCIAEVRNDQDFLPFRLAVVESSAPLPGERAGSTVTHSVGEPISLPCVTTAAPDAEINWIFPDGSKGSIKANSSKAYVFLNGTLYIPHSQLSNNGYYKCVAVNQHGTDTLASKVTITGKEGLQPLRRIPMKPQSAAGVSTKIKAFIDDTDESSGDYDIWRKTPNAPNNARISRPRVPHTRIRGHPQRHPQRRPYGRKKPTGKGYIEPNRKHTPEQRRNSGTPKAKIDPQKWADILAKIRQKTAPIPTAPSLVQTSSPVKKVPNEELSNSNRPEPGDSIEGSTPDDTALPEEGLNVLNTPRIPLQIPQHQTVIVPTRTQDQTNDVYKIHTANPNTDAKEQTPLLDTAVKPTFASDKGQHESHAAKIENSHAFTVLTTTLQPKHTAIIEDSVIPLHTDLEVNTNKVSENSLTTQFTTSTPAAKSTSTAVAKLGAPITLVPSRSNTQGNSRRRYGNRRRMNRLRPRPPISRLTTPKPQLPLTTTTPSSHSRSTEAALVSRSTLPTPGPFTKHTTHSERTFSAQDDKILTKQEQGRPDEAELGREQAPPESTSSTLLSFVTAQGKPQAYEHTVSSVASPTPEQSHKSVSLAAGHKESTAAISDIGLDEKIKSEDVATTLTDISHVLSQSEVNNEHDSRPDGDDSRATSPPTMPGEDVSSVREIPITVKPPTAVSESHHGTPYKESPQSVVMTIQHENSVVSSNSQTPLSGENKENDLHPKETVTTVTTIEPATTTDITTTASSTAAVLTSTTASTPVPTTAITASTIATTMSTTTQKITAMSTTASTRLRPSLTLPGNNRVFDSSRYPGGNYIPDRHSERVPSINYRPPYYPNNRNPFVIRRPDLNRVPSVTTSPEQSGQVNNQKSINTKANTSSTAASTTTTPTTVLKTHSSSKFKTQHQTSQSSTNRHSTTVFSSTSYDGSSPHLKAKPKITTDNIYTFRVNASTDVLLPCDAVGEPKPFLTWTKVSTGRKTTISNMLQKSKGQFS